MAHKLTQLIIYTSILAVNVAFAATDPPGGDNSAILMWIIGGLCTVLFTIACFVLSKVDRNQTKLFERQDDMIERLVRIETKCEKNHD